MSPNIGILLKDAFKPNPPGKYMFVEYSWNIPM